MNKWKLYGIFALIITAVFPHSPVSANNGVDSFVPAVNKQGVVRQMPISAINNGTGWNYQTYATSIMVTNSATTLPVINASASVTLNNFAYSYTQSFTPQTLTTSALGMATFQSLLPGNYHITVVAEGLNTYDANFDSSQSLLNITLSQRYLFNDEFSSNNIDTNKWSVYDNGSTIGTNNGLLSFYTNNDAARGNKYPYLHSKFINFGSSSYEFTLRFKVNSNGIDSSNQNNYHPIYIGIGSQVRPQDINFGDSPYINATSFWMRIQPEDRLFVFGGTNYGGLGDAVKTISLDYGWHVLKVKFVKTGLGTFTGIPSFSLDGDTYTSAECNCGGGNGGNPSYVWIGAPSGNYYPYNYNYFYGLDVDYIRVK